MKYVLVLFIVFSSSAHAYLDPGSGSAIIQGVIAFLAIILFNIKQFVAHIKLLINRIINFLKG
jgi:hypothetical protein